MYQKLTLIGHLGADPEMRYTAQGDAVVNFSVATSRKWTTADGKPGEQTTWFRVTAWRKLAENCNQYLKKGSKVFVEGQMTPDLSSGGPRLWETSDGQPRASFEMCGPG